MHFIAGGRLSRHWRLIVMLVVSKFVSHSNSIPYFARSDPSCREGFWCGVLHLRNSIQSEQVTRIGNNGYIYDEGAVGNFLHFMLVEGYRARSVL